MNNDIKIVFDTRKILIGKGWFTTINIEQKKKIIIIIF